MDPSQLTPEMLANTPLFPNPSGAPPNFDDPKTNTTGAIAAMSVMMAVMYVILFARVITRWGVVKQFGVDDYAIIVAVVLMTAFFALTVNIFNHGAMGRHGYDVPLAKVLDPYFGTSLFTLQFIGPLAAFFAKISILCFLQRLFPRFSKRIVAYLIWVGIRLNTVVIVAVTITFATMCYPDATGQTPRDRCPEQTQINIAQITAGLFLFLDLFVLALAVPSLWTLQMSRARKLGAVGVLGLGLAACACSALVLYYRVHNKVDFDPTWTQIAPITVANFEGMTGIITACLPTLPALWVDMQKNLFPSIRRMLSTLSFISSNRGSFSAADSHNPNNDHELRNRSVSSSARSLNAKDARYDIEAVDRESSS